MADPTLSPLIASDIANLESRFGLPAESVHGSTGPTRSTRSAARKGLAKCKRIRNKNKQARCRKKAKRKLKTA